MKKRDTLTKPLAIVGTIAIWLPILTPFFLAAVRFFGIGQFRFDYLLPAELGLLVLGGVAALLYAALRAKSRVKWIAWTTGVAVFLLFGSMGLAALTGLANGSTPMGGWQWAVVLSMLIGYDLVLVALGIGGIFLIRDLFKR